MRCSWFADRLSLRGGRGGAVGSVEVEVAFAWPDAATDAFAAAEVDAAGGIVDLIGSWGVRCVVLIRW